MPRYTGLTLRPDGHVIDGQGCLIENLAFANSRWIAHGNWLDSIAPPAQAQRILAALRRRPLRGDQECLTVSIPHGATAPLLTQMAAMSSPSGLAAFGAGNTLAVRTRQRLRCLSS